MYLTKQQVGMLKGIALLFMIWHHLFAFPYRLIEGVSYTSLGGSDGYGWEFVFGVFGKLCVPLYIFLSGYGLWFATQSLTGASLRRDLFRRGKQVVFKYWKVFFVVVGIMTFLLKVPFRLDVFLQNFMGLYMFYDGNWWFLKLYLFLLICYPWIRKVVNSGTKVTLRWVLFFAGVYQIVYLIYRNNETLFFPPYLSGFEVEGVLFGIPMMMIGGWVAKNQQEGSGCWLFKSKPTLFKKIALLLSLILIRLGLIIWLTWKGIFVMDLVLTPLFCYAISELITNTWVFNQLAFLGRWSTWGWLVHGLFLHVRAQRFTYVLKNPFLIFCLVLGLTILLSMLIQVGYDLLFKKRNSPSEAKNQRRKKSNMI